MSDLALGVNVAGVADAIAALQRIGAAMGTTTQQTRQSNQANQDNGRTQDAAGMSALQFGQRLAGAANAVQSLVGQLGGGSHAAGLIGATANSAVQFAQLGGAIGPQGALVGGIVGAAIPALHELMTAFDDTAVRATHAGDSIEQMVTRYTAMQDASALAQRLADGTATIAERATQATQAQARYSQSLSNGVELQNRLNAALDEDSTLSQRLAGNVLPPVGMAMEALHQVRLHDIEALRASVEQSNLHTAAMRGEADAATALAGAMTPMTAQEIADSQLAEMERQQGLHDSDARAGRKHAGGGGQTRDSRADEALAALRSQIDALEQGPDAQLLTDTQQLETAYTAAWSAAYDGASNYGASLATLIETLHSFQATQLDASQASREDDAAETQRVTDLANLKSHFREVEAHELADATSQRHKALQQETAEENATKAKLAQNAHERTATTQAATGQMIGELTNVFTLIGEGQANAAQGAELLLASFLKYISQRATIEALAQVAQAIGSYPDPAGMALHAAAAVAWGAVAVATGVGGNILANDAQGQMNAAHQGATSRDTASAAREQSSQQAGGNLTLNIYPGGFITKADVSAGAIDILNHAARNGFRVDPRIIRQAT